MGQLYSIQLTQLRGYGRLRLRFSQPSPIQTWSPDLNAYLCSRQMLICLDLAGVDPTSLDLRIERRRLLVRGQRELPQPGGEEDKPLQTLAMEIDYGSFEREIVFPVDVDTERSTAEHRNGLLWIRLPLHSEETL